MLWTSSVIYLVTPLLWLVKTPADMNELRDLHSSALILIASKIIMAMLAIRRGFRTFVLHFFKAWVAWTESDVTPDKLINSLMTVMWLFYLIEDTDIVLWI